MSIDTQTPLTTNGNGGELSFPNWRGQNFPYKSVLSLKPLLDYWNQQSGAHGHKRSDYFQKIVDELNSVPEMLRPIENMAELEQHQELIHLLMSTAFPLIFQDNALSAAVVPFQQQALYATSAFKKLGIPVNCQQSLAVDLSPEGFLFKKIIYAGTAILKKFYDFEIAFNYPMIVRLPDAKTGLEKHYQFNFNPRFVELKSVGRLKPLRAKDKRRLLDNLTNIEVWLELLPPEKFEFHGFAVLSAVDVTAQEVLSSLKNDLLEKDALISAAKFDGLQTKIRAILQKPQVKLGLAGIPGSFNMLQGQGLKIGRSFILDDRCRYHCSSFAGSLYERAIKQRDTVIVEDLSTYENATEVEKEIMSQGIKNLLIAPVHYGDQLVGLIEIGSPNPADINDLNTLIFDQEVLSLFSIAIRRSMDEMNDRIEAVIKDQCTAIHPAVEWRFRQAATKALQSSKNGIASEMEEIIFKDVYPLYGLSDIRGSSTLRNNAIQADLVDQLAMAKDIILTADAHKHLPFLDKLRFQIDRYIGKIKKDIGSGDEVSILDFLHWEIEPHFDHLQQFGDDVKDKIEAYRSVLDRQLGVLYERRKDFEESVNELNEAISTLIEKKQVDAQKMFPHYFEKYKSDGIDYGIYIGASLVEDGKFDQLYLKNVRLWQLLLMCDIVRLAEKTKPALKVPLDLAHLVLVQNSPLSIRFRYDEKQFDVDGAYNVRYEIMKKRIDKAVVKTTGERVTQPGKIAIIYSQSREATEYHEYIDFLQAEGALTGEVEDLELENLQGMHGLRALRVTVKTGEPRIGENGQEHRTKSMIERELDSVISQA